MKSMRYLIDNVAMYAVAPLKIRLSKTSILTIASAEVRVYTCEMISNKSDYW